MGNLGGDNINRLTERPKDLGSVLPGLEKAWPGR